VIVLITTTLGGDGESSDGKGGGSDRAEKVEPAKDKGPAPKSYEVQSGDTLTSIAQETDVPVAIIVKLNPGVDPQILIAGEKLKLR
jgi:LysM repeat protein